MLRPYLPLAPRTGGRVSESSWEKTRQGGFSLESLFIQSPQTPRFFPFVISERTRATKPVPGVNTRCSESLLFNNPLRERNYLCRERHRLASKRRNAGALGTFSILPIGLTFPFSKKKSIVHASLAIFECVSRDCCLMHSLSVSCATHRLQTSVTYTRDTWCKILNSLIWPLNQNIRQSDEYSLYFHP